MANRVKRKDLEKLINEGLKTALNRPDCSWFNIDMDSISVTIKIPDETIAGKFLQTINYDNSPFAAFKEYLENHTGENLKPTGVRKENSIIIQVNYDIIE